MWPALGPCEYAGSPLDFDELNRVAISQSLRCIEIAHGVDAHGHAEVSDVGPGDLGYFPPGVPHSIQGPQDGCEFLLVFDDGNFGEFDTFLITDRLGRWRRISVPRPARQARRPIHLTSRCGR